jgi:acetyl-CoA carboxylase biotin carboxyl carrier protein
MSESEPAGDLAEVRDTVVQLLAATPWTPATLRVSAGAVSVELTWTAVPAAPVPLSVTPAVAVAVAEPDPGAVVRSPAVGIFYRAPTPGAPPFVTSGDRVAPGQQVGIVEMMKMMIPVEAEVHGIVTDLLVADATSVEFAEPLMALAPAIG